MASNEWHRMNNIVCEIERNRERMTRAMLHAKNNPGSLLANKLHELKAKHDALYDALYDHTAEWLEKLEGGENGKSH